MVYEILLPTSIFLDDQTLAPRLTFLPRVPALSGQCPAGVAECGAIAATPHMRLPRCAPELDGKTCETAGNNHIYIHINIHIHICIYIYIYLCIYIYVYIYIIIRVYI